MRKGPPDRVCCIAGSQWAWFEKRGPSFRCMPSKRRRHIHLTREEVLTLIGQGKAEWVGDHQIAARMITAMEWHKVLGLAGEGNARVAAMQMLHGGEQRFPRMVIGGLVSPR